MPVDKTLFCKWEVDAHEWLRLLWIDVARRARDFSVDLSGLLLFH